MNTNHKVALENDCNTLLSSHFAITRLPNERVVYCIGTRTNESYKRVVGVAQRGSHWVRARRDQTHVASSTGRSAQRHHHQHGRTMEAHLHARRPRVEPRGNSMDKPNGKINPV